MNEKNKRTVIFDPLNEDCKSPLGAVKVNEPIKLKLSFSRPSNPAEVFFVLTKDGEEDVYYPMSYASTDLDGTYNFTASITVTSRGLYFYRFIVNTETEQYRIAADNDPLHPLQSGPDALFRRGAAAACRPLHCARNLCAAVGAHARAVRAHARLCTARRSVPQRRAGRLFRRN